MMLEEHSSNVPESENNNTEQLEKSKEQNSAQDNFAVNKPTEEVFDEIDENNAEDAEDTENQKRHSIPLLDYHAMSMKEIVLEFEKLLKNEKIQAIKTHVDEIKSEFDLKFQELLDEKKEEFINDGGNEVDFNYTTSEKTKFNQLYKEYKEKRNQYYKNLEQNLKLNLAKRLEIIEDLKGLINIEENINTTYKHFKEIQEKWHQAGPVPRMHYNNVWRTYHHHVEIFYDFLDLNRDLRDLDFKRNLEEKEKLIAKAEALLEEKDVLKAFRELQTLHKIWKEDIGPVDREHREVIWEKFSAVTKTLHDERQKYFNNLDQIHEDNLVKKLEIIEKIKEIGTKEIKSHNLWQKNIKEIEALRDAFFKAGRVPKKLSNQTWDSFKEAVKNFNRKKNTFYKHLKHEQHTNLEQKLELVKLAESLKDSEDWAATTPVMKKVQADWKKIGHVPKKYSDKIWEDFKNACNHYFDRLHAKKHGENEEEFKALDSKKELLNKLNNLELSNDTHKDTETIKLFITEWRSLGKVPFNKRNIESTFNKTLDNFLNELKLEKQEIELIKYGNKLEQLANAESDKPLNNEITFIRRKIDEVKGEIRQLENNLQFINADDNNPIVKEVLKNIANHKESLNIWKAKLKEIKSLNL